MKPKHKSPMQQQTMSHVEQLKTYSRGKVTAARHTNHVEEAQRKQQKCDIRKQAYFAKKTIKFGHLLSRGK